MSQITVTALRQVFRRAGIEFSREPRVLDCDQLTPEQLAAIEADPQLIVQHNPQREGDASKSGARANSSRASDAAAGEPNQEATPEGKKPSGTAGGVPPNVDSGSRGEGAGQGPVAPGSSAPSRTTRAPAKKAAAKTPKAKA